MTVRYFASLLSLKICSLTLTETISNTKEPPKSQTACFIAQNNCSIQTQKFSNRKRWKQLKLVSLIKARAAPVYMVDDHGVGEKRTSFFLFQILIWPK